MDLRRLRFIVRVSDESSFTRAAQSLNVSQPTLSQQVRDLERELGVELFHRGSRRVETTQAGRLVVQHARIVLGAVEALKEAVVEHRGLKRGSLHIGVTQTFNALYLPPILTAFASDYPTIDLEVSELANAEIVDGIISGTLHLGVGIPQDAELEHIEPLYRDQLMFVCHSSHRLARARTVAIREIAEESLALLGERFRTRTAVDSYLEGQGVAPRRVLVFNTFAGILQTVSRGGHSTIMPADVSRGAGANDLRFVPLDPAPIERVVCLLSPVVGLRSPASIEMARRIRSRFAAPYEGTD
ncbi:LysR family transcriptional regulator [Sphingomonas sp. IBVSS2]|uniref:LysR substrate-binding domain-containing protein n=1 Tax=Sphingomonas sp. IBVSS2 TaxID=1985172 RepID=UPI000A2E7F63|nr:LysR substrate-binding domain-containing protein [Sphingomonas sp. IBVSS2]OSZ62683.1 LysR family transcriptional regulator [Sphingomonas sp. IBVSS2]